MGVVKAVFILLGLQSIGEMLTAVLGWPVPGTVIGLLLLLAAVLSRYAKWAADSPPNELSRLVDGLHAHMGIMFVPAGAGVVACAPEITQAWPCLLAALLVSTIVTIAVVALVSGTGPRRAVDREIVGD